MWSSTPVALFHNASPRSCCGSSQSSQPSLLQVRPPRRLSLEKRSLASQLGVSSAKQEFFNAPILDSSVFYEMDKSKSQAELGFDPRKTSILCVSYIPRPHALELAKNPYLMVDMVREAIDLGGEELVVYVAGWGVGLEEFKEYVRSSGVAGHFRILGRVDHPKLPRYYSATDLVWLPIGQEQLNEGLVTAEAFACGRPVVAFKRWATDKTEQKGGFLLDRDPATGGKLLLERVRDQSFWRERERRERRWLSNTLSNPPESGSRRSTRGS